MTFSQVLCLYRQTVASDFTDALIYNSKLRRDAVSKRVRQAQQQMEVRSDEVRAG